MVGLIRSGRDRAATPLRRVGEQLARARDAYERVLADARSEWEASADATQRGLFAPELPGLRVLEQEDDLLSLLEAPRVLPLLSQCIGEDLQCSDAFLRYNPGGGDPSTVFSGGWHRDTGNWHNNATGRSLALKVFYYFYDVETNGGATALVPKSHTSDIHPRTLPDEIKENMPGHVITAGKAGTAVIFEKRTWHSRTINSRPLNEARRCMTIIYLNWW